MISNKNEYNEYILYEKEKYNISNDFIEYIKYLCGSERATIWYYQKRLRKTEYYYNTKKKLRYYFSSFLLRKKSIKYGIRIAPNVCDKGLRIMHLGSILVNSDTSIGKDVSLHINTAFVAKGVSKDAPRVGDGCVVGVGAVVLGGVEIANNVAIGANSVVCKDILEENIAVAGAPAHKVSNNGRLEWERLIRE